MTNSALLPEFVTDFPAILGSILALAFALRFFSFAGCSAVNATVRAAYRGMVILEWVDTHFV